MNVQYSGNIELTDEVLDLLADKVAERLGDGGGKAPAKKAPAKTSRRGKKAAEEDNSEAIEAFKTEMEELTEGVKAKEVKEFLAEWEYKSIGHCDPKDFDEILEAAREEFGGEEDGDNDEEITVDVVKPLCQKAAKLDKEAMTELYEEFEISGIRGLGKLGEEDLEDLHAAVTEIIEEAE